MPADFTNLSGQTIKGYELRQLIGHGGFGAVYRAYQPSVDREVAIKLILPEHANNPEFIRRFESEAQVIARLEHPHITPLYDYWREPDMAVLVMRLLRGGSLQDSLEQKGAWQPSQVVQLVSQIAGALTIAHRNSIVHRDLKPANILLDEEGNAYLADFGIAKRLNQPTQTITDEDRYGSPAFISPEQVIGQPVSPQTDIYSLGMVIYVALSGQTPFFDSNTDTVIRKQLSESLPPLQTHRSDLPYAVNIIIWRATSKRPEARYPDALALAADLKQVITGESANQAVQVSTPSIPRVLSNPNDINTIIIEPPTDLTNPYKGLQAFQESDASDFFGRSALIDRLVKKLSSGNHDLQFLAIIGPSGSGKSSIARAGLIPALKRGALFGSQEWFYIQMTPSSNPLQELADQLLGIAAKIPPAFTELFMGAEDALTEIIPQLLPADEGVKLLLLIDQFEELFTLVPDEKTREHFIKLLVHAANTPASQLRIVITLRADFYDRPLQYANLSALMRDNTEIVLPLTSPEMEQAIVEPSDRYAIQFEAGLVARIMSDVNQQPGALPLLQFALTELFNKRHKYIMTLAVYEEFGGVLGALAQRAEELYTSLDSYSQAAAKQMFLRLVSTTEGADDTRRRVTRTELNSISSDKSIVQGVIDAFGKYRLLTFDYEPGTRTPTVEVAHEALIRVWDRLHDWLETSREDLRLHNRLSTSTTEWVNAKKDASFLASGSRLIQFEPLGNSPVIKLTQDESAYLWASVAARQAASIRIRNGIIALSIFALFAAILAIFAFDRQRQAETQTERANNEATISRSRELAVTALRPENRLDLALLLSLEAVRTSNTFEARNGLVSNLQNKPGFLNFLTAHTDTIRALAYSPDGKILASAGRDLAIILWDTTTNQPIGEPLLGHTNYINNLAFSPDSQTLVSVSVDGTARRWDVTTAQQLGEPLSMGGAEIWSVAYNPDGASFATGNELGNVIVWNADDGAKITELQPVQADLIFALAYNPDGSLLASGSGDSTIQLWDAASYEPLGEPLAEHAGSVLTLTFSPDGSRLASSGNDGTVIFWDVATGEFLYDIVTGHTKRVKAITFNNDGSELITASDDNLMRVWDSETLQQIGPDLVGYSAIWSIAFNPTNDTFAAAASDNAVMLWSLNANPPLVTYSLSEPSNILTVAYSPDGKMYATAGGSKGEDNRIHLWNATDNTEISTMQGHIGYISELTFSPDSTRLVSAGSDNTLHIWDVAKAVSLSVIPLTGNTRYIPVAFSPDGSTIASGSADGNIALWNAQTGVAIDHTLVGHTADILSLAFSPDGKFLASGSADHTVRLWDVAAQEQVGEPFEAHTDEVWAVKFSPNGQTLASGGSDQTIRLWDVQTHQTIGQPLIGHTDRVKTLGFTPNGTMLVSGGQDNALIIWDLTQRLPLGKPLTGHTNYINSLSINPDGRDFISGGEDNQIIKWSIDLATWQQNACSIANRNFSPTEWSRYFAEEVYRQTCP
ncbi:MAG: protein kinase [Chloroflexi bacterium]|nr:protein kinase [Chloroflexota bacterium]MCC6894079.1 protein kinase [Anaerolineae bacterium]